MHPGAMTKTDRKNQKIRRNSSNVRFQDFVSWLEDNGFFLDRVSGSHHIFVHPTIETPINARKKKDGTAKAYQIKQAIKIIDGE
jgi:predicted RNA binding protein YcfA (HicA-like mRNA interferase family)